MSVADFTKTLQSQVYKNWLNSLEKNIITSSAKALRDREQTAEKTSFYIAKSKIKEMYKTITGTDMDDLEAQLFFQELLSPLSEKGSRGSILGTTIKVGNENAVFFKNIGFGTISTKLSDLFNSYPAVEDAYKQAEQDYYDNEIKTLRNSPEYKKLSLKEKKKAEADIEKKAKERGTLGYYYNKGHVISVATNLIRQFRQELAKSDALAKQQQKILLDVLDRYIDKLVKDDLMTANLPNAVNQELYANYIKSSDVYLVEMQHRVTNIESGAASVAIIDELRKLFNFSSDKEFSDTITKSPLLANALATAKGSPSFVDLLVADLVSILSTGNKNPKTYKIPPVLIAKKSSKIAKSSNKSKVSEAKALRNKIQRSIQKKTDTIEKKLIVPSAYGLDLVSLINAALFEQIKKNMGTGNRPDILNFRTGRFARSVNVERISESRQGMITAFYSYMKNPYATFSQGGRQQFPRSRDPKLLISKSIREIAASLVSNRLRAVNV